MDDTRKDPDPGMVLARAGEPQEPGQGSPGVPTREYAILRLEVARKLEGLCEDKVNALNLLARLEAALWASVLLYQATGARSRQAFAAGLKAFLMELDGE